MTIDDTKLHKIIQQVIKDVGATFHAPLVLIGEKLGLFKAIAGAGLLTAKELAQRTGTFERYVGEWHYGLMCQPPGVLLMRTCPGCTANFSCR